MSAPGADGPAVAAPADGFGRARKRSVTIAGHETSIALEPAFWTALEEAALRRRLPLNALIAAVDALRILAPAPANLSSALRSWVLDEVRMRTGRITVDSANDSQ